MGKPAKRARLKRGTCKRAGRDTRRVFRAKLLFTLCAVTGATPAPETVPHVDHATRSSSELVSALFVFMLAAFVGLEVIRRVSRLLHTPLMSLTNAISA